MPRRISQHSLTWFDCVTEAGLRPELVFDGQKFDDFEVGCFVAGLDLFEVVGFGVEHSLDLLAVLLQIFN